MSLRRLREEDGIALVMALGITVVLIIFVASMISYTSQNSRNANDSRSRLGARVTCGPASTMDKSGTNAKIEGLIVCGKFKFFTNTKLMPLPTITEPGPGRPCPAECPATISTPVITSG